MYYGCNETPLYEKTENAVQFLQKVAGWDADYKQNKDYTTYGLYLLGHWQELKEAMKTYLSKPNAIKFIISEAELNDSDITAAAELRKPCVFEDDVLACFHFDKSDHSLLGR